ncbi:MAG: hypothetical protein LBJ01_12230 [Tannerella sp.]|jgi:hypothetical protein|nr:hypothetical protein [Tannerella sp.]
MDVLAFFPVVASNTNLSTSIRRQRYKLFLKYGGDVFQRVHFNLSCAVIATKEAIADTRRDCFPAFAMTVHGALSCNDGHRYEERHVEMHPVPNVALSTQVKFFQVSTIEREKMITFVRSK